MTRQRFVAVLLPVALVVSLAAPSATPAAAYPAATIELVGRGFGHGRGMGQWGAYGYAAEYGWTHQQILAHYYGGTGPGARPNGPVTVRLQAQDGRDLVVTSDTAFRVGPHLVAGGWAARIARQADGSYVFWTRPGCGAADAFFGGGVNPQVASTVADPGDDLSRMLSVCQPDGRRTYRGQLTMTFGDGAVRTVNTVALEDYLRGVVPRESWASWADSGGAAALAAQAVAARTYALNEGGGEGRQRFGYAKTCDSQSCQVYGGSAFNGTRLEDRRTDAAVAGTRGEVRQTPAGALVSTEFSASSGGWTAGGAFPAVEDRGDTRSPYHQWSASIAVSSIVARWPQLGAFLGIEILVRNGIGPDGGRVRRLVLRGSSADVVLTGEQFRFGVGLRSDWFSLAGALPTPTWYLGSGSNPPAVDAMFTYGLSSDRPMACDIDGDRTDAAVVQRGEWFHLRGTNVSGPAQVSLPYGIPGDVGVCGDWDGNGTDTIGVYRSGWFYLRNSNTPGSADLAFPYGNAGDLPVVGDWNGDGVDTVGVRRGDRFFLRDRNDPGPGDRVVHYGAATDHELVGDWNGDGVDTVGVARSDRFFLRNSNTDGVADEVVLLGVPGDHPLVGDWNGDRTSRPGVVRRW